MLRRTLLGALAMSVMASAAWIGGATSAVAQPSSTDLTIDGIGATWITPAASRFPAVLIIEGSGPTDRNGNGRMGQLRTDCYRLLAEALAQRGIASLRFDKRGVGASHALVGDAAAASRLVLDDFVTDAARLAAWIRGQPGVASLVVAGHSEGGLIGLRLGAATRLDGLVLLAAPGRPLGDILLEQLKRQPLPDATQKEAMRVVGALSEGGEVGTVKPPLDQLFAPIVHPFLRSVFRERPATLAASRSEPLLVIGGGKDIQVPRADFDALAAARPDATVSHWFEEMTHVLKAFRASDPAQTALYREPEHPLMTGLGEYVAEWILSLKR